MSEQEQAERYSLSQAEDEASALKTVAQDVKIDEVRSGPDAGEYHGANVETARNIPTTPEHYRKAETRAEKLVEVCKALGKDTWGFDDATLLALDEINLQELVEDVRKMPEGEEKETARDLLANMGALVAHKEYEYGREQAGYTKNEERWLEVTKRIRQQRENNLETIYDTLEKIYGNSSQRWRDAMGTTENSSS